MELRGGDTSNQMFFPGFETTKEDLHAKWENARDKEKKSRSKFAQLSIKTTEVYEQLQAIQTAIGTGPALRSFVESVCHLAGVPVSPKRDEVVEIGISNETPRALRHAVGEDDPFLARFDPPVAGDVRHLARTSPIVEGLSAFTLETALDEVQSEGERPVARRCGVTHTDAVTEKTSILLVRFRFHLLIKRRGEDATRPLLAEEVRALAFTGTPAEPVWLDDEAGEALLSATPSGNVSATLVKQQLQRLVDCYDQDLRPTIETIAVQRAKLLADAHSKVRKSAKQSGKVECNPVDTADVLGCFVLLPKP
jgi:hypothetical protein